MTQPPDDETLEQLTARESGHPPPPDDDHQEGAETAPDDLFNHADCLELAAALELAANEWGYWAPARGERLRKHAKVFRERADVLQRVAAETPK